MIQKLVCIVCPNGCEIEAEIDKDNQILSLSGATCRRGEAFARQELLDPQRTIASSVRLTGGELPLASVRLDKPVPKALIPEIMKAIRAETMQAPVSIGDVVLANVCGTQSNVIITRNIAKSK